MRHYWELRMAPALQPLPSGEWQDRHCLTEPTQPGTLCTALRAHPHPSPNPCQPPEHTKPSPAEAEDVLLWGLPWVPAWSCLPPPYFLCAWKSAVSLTWSQCQWPGNSICRTSVWWADPRPFLALTGAAFPPGEKRKQGPAAQTRPQKGSSSPLF